ncbi:hypothetical protein SCHPADRAFT_942936 [Schizopora paradoxa]|uniref:Uncharacterized protein n=1 Tax=Schizopora paradoxa TaxID=27342 RepID=A0A0H2REP5_9AGAM|nr:hypothetical protein SCHPADRAFT_942936 [Schizopora paradoxa]
MDQEMARLQSSFPPWLWNAFEAYFRAEERNRGFMLGFDHVADARLVERIRQLKVAKRQSIKKDYPTRPNGLSPNSESFAALNKLLADAPGTDAEGFDFEEESPEGLSVEQDGFERVYVVNWTQGFRDSVRLAVEAVIAEHGNGFKNRALWLVYNAHVRCVGGLVYCDHSRPHFWHDEAAWVFSELLH